MIVLSGALSVSRFRCDGQPTETPIELVEKLQKQAFISIDQCNEEKSQGWVSAFDFLDSSFAIAPDLGEYLFFSLRIDTRKVNSAVLKKEVIIALKKEEELNRKMGKKFISRERKKEIKEQVKIRLLQKTLPVPKTIPAAWNMSAQTLYLFSTSSKECDLFEELFIKTFEIGLNKIDFYTAASEILSPADLEILDSILSSQFVSPTLSDGAFLGGDFLNYLWFISDSQNYQTGLEYTFCIGDSVRVAGELGSLSATSSSGELSEALYGIANGKKVCSLKFIIDTNEATTFKAKLDTHYILSGIKLPKTEISSDEVDDEALLLEKMFLLEKLISYIEKIFGVFLEKRLNSSQWQTICSEITQWANKKN